MSDDDVLLEDGSGSDTGISEDEQPAQPTRLRPFRNVGCHSFGGNHQHAYVGYLGGSFLKR